MGKNNAKKLKHRLISSDPGAANRLNNMRLNNSRIRDLVATEVAGHYDLSHDLDAFDVAMQIGIDKDPVAYFDELDVIQIDDLRIEGDEVMLFEDEEEDCAYESLIDSIIEDDYGFAEDMANSAIESSFDIPVFDFDDDDEIYAATEGSDSRQEAEDEIYEMLLEEDAIDDDIDLDDDFDPELDDDDDFEEPSEEEIIDMEDDDLLDPSMDELL